jgi:hypothetical protein
MYSCIPCEHRCRLKVDVAVESDSRRTEAHPAIKHRRVRGSSATCSNFCLTSAALFSCGIYTPVLCAISKVFPCRKTSMPCKPKPTLRITLRAVVWRNDQAALPRYTQCTSANVTVE